MSLEILATGWGSSIQDAGRWGWAHLGVPASGAVDPALAALMNRLVGNPPGAALFETAGGLHLQATAPLVIASSDTGSVRSLHTGDRYLLAPSAERNFGYLAVRGGVDVAPVLGSRSQDLTSGVGPPPLVRGMVLAVGSDPGAPVTVDQAPLRMPAGAIRVWPGPDLAAFAPGSFGMLTRAAWTPLDPINRVGLRLAGPLLERVGGHERPSEGLIPGAVQVPPDGQPIALLRDHPTTGGYPVIAVVDPVDLGRLAQTRPGQPLHLVPAHGDAAGEGRYIHR